jgi:transcriptional regulator with XRE-family HTH domain
VRAGLSQEELGYRADLHRTYLSMLERGVRCPSLETIAKLAKALDTKASELVAAWERRFGSQ